MDTQLNPTQVDVIAPDVAGSLPGLFFERLARCPDNTAYQYFDAASQRWHSLTWQQTAEQISRWQRALASAGLTPGERVALNLRNCPEWVYFDIAAMSLGLVTVPLYPEDRPDNMAYILEQTDSKILLLQSKRQWQQLKSALTEQHAIEKVVILNLEKDEEGDIAVLDSDRWLDRYPHQTLIRKDLDGYKLASIIYTSGTTGRPKGVMLSHQNMLSVAYGALQFFDVFHDDVFLSFLPLSHTLERTGGYYLPMMAGASVTYSRGVAKLPDDLRQVKPTILIAVPRLFERFSAQLNQQLATKSWFQKCLFKLVIHAGWRRFLWQQKQANWHVIQILWPILGNKIADKFLQRLGGRLRLAVSGGAALPGYAAKLFIGLQLRLIQGYGLTETSPIISVNPPEKNRPQSVGPPIPGVTTKIDPENQELLVDGPGKMLGYWNNHKATAQTIDVDGWLHTGDQAKCDEQGYIHITGRIKDILVLSNGEKFPPSDIENALLQDPLFEQAIVVGEGQSYLAALLVLDGEAWQALAQSLGLDPMRSDSLQDKTLQQTVLKRCRNLLRDFPAYVRIRRIALTLHPWTIENGLLTPTMKVRREAIIKRYQADIDALFAADSA
ncbi:Long-chain-fatty-acid--CoA ligase [Methylophaga frappieri]|uniref:Long-chain-fatty-acid--CoA ligase n=1 Tax=Methylophaga frappieri (strain ATCC BAA-2434 / DSM 25690 / JAM7) TaxID=754477 RepID=I1YL59_METFJ|nr:long-chain fatty acid--CoA ligase [Methylophaga frappieri]AFJ03652.1 Long-chain-fatty-acid--CoA ligase [Methylophaga frappieri]